MLATALLSLAAIASAAESTATLKAVDLYRSNVLTVAQVRKAAGPLLDSYLRLRGDKQGSAATRDKLLAEIETRVRDLGHVAFVRLSYSEYVTSAERTAYATFDIVDAADVSTRMPFLKAPQGQVADPDGVLAGWRQYAAQGEGLARSSDHPMVDHPSCPAFYCLWGSPTPELAALEQSFTAAAASRRAKLLEVLAKDADARDRAAAVYVLSYSTDGVVAVDAAMAALKDPSEEARAAGLSVLADVSLYHKGVFIEVSKIFPILDYPTVADRSKALSVLVGLADNPSFKTYLAGRAGPYLLAMLRLKQPANHDLAYTLLSTLSGKSFDADDFDAWEKWAKEQPNPAVLSGVSVEVR